MDHFTGIYLLILGLVCFVVVLGFAVHLGLKAFRLIRRGYRISKVALPLADGLARRSEDLTKLSYHLGQKVDRIALNLDDLDRSVHRLTVLLQAFNDSMRPYRKVRDYLGL
jgi:hypothetical protein